MKMTDNKNIDREVLLKLSKMSRIDVLEEEEEGLLKDMANILNYFEELNQLDVSSASIVLEASELEKRLKEDVVKEDLIGLGYDNFPETKNHYLVVPNVKDSHK